MTLDEKISLLNKPARDYQDVMKYANVSRQTAYRIIKKARANYDGALPCRTMLTKVDSILKGFGTSRTEELLIALSTKGAKSNDDIHD